MGRPIFLLLAASLATAPALAADADGLQQVLDGFDDEAVADDGGLADVLEGFESPTEPAAAAPDVAFETAPVSGSVSLSAHYVYGEHDLANRPDYHGLARLRSRLDLEYEEDLGPDWRLFASGYAFYDAAYSVRDRSEIPEKTLDELEQEAELGVTYVRGRLSRSTDLTLGRQIVVWGKSDNLRVTDILNPLDNREPGVTDIRNLRLPVTMGRLDYYVGDWNFSAIAIPEIRFEKQPPFGSAYYPVARPAPPEEVPDDGGSNTEYAASASATFSGWDIAFYWAQVFDDRSQIIGTAAGPRSVHSRLTMNGVAAAAVQGNWILRGEAARFDGVKFTGLPDESFERTDLMVGFDYAGFANTTLSLELADRHINDYDPRLQATNIREDTPQVAVRYQGDFLYDRLHLTALGLVQGNGDGGFSRYQAEYDLSDALAVLGGVVLYHNGDALPFSGIADNDRVITEVRYSF